VKRGLERLKIWKVMGVDDGGERGVNGAKVADGCGNLAVGGKGAEERCGGMDARLFRVRILRGRGVLSEAFLRTIRGYD
jgi:hypothetical protein